MTCPVSADCPHSGYARGPGGEPLCHTSVRDCYHRRWTVWGQRPVDTGIGIPEARRGRTMTIATIYWSRDQIEHACGCVSWQEWMERDNRWWTFCSRGYLCKTFHDGPPHDPGDTGAGDVDDWDPDGGRT